MTDADALLLITDWSEYKRPNWSKAKGLMRRAQVFDFRNQYDRAAMEKVGVAYDCIGRPAPKNSNVQ